MFRKFYGMPIIATAVYMAALCGPVNAADFGSDCCADLEERVAELEATAARKGNRVVSLTVTGQVSKALLFWDDGFESDTYVVDNGINISRFGFNGKAQISPDLTAGYVMEIDVRDSVSFAVSQNSDENPPPVSDIAIRLSHVYIQSETFGKIALGENYSFSDAISVPLQLGNTFNTDGGPYADGFSLINPDGTSSGVTWNRLIGNGPRRNNYLRYDSPDFAGFSVTAMWGDDDVWDIGAKYLGTVGRFRLHTAIDYFNYDAEPLGSAGLLSKFEEVKGLVSIKDLPTGLFLTTWVAQRDYVREVLGSGEDTGQSVQFFAGIENNFTGYGNTTIYGGYGRFEDMASTGLDINLAGGVSATVIDADIDRITLGAVQTFDAAGLDIYGIVEHFSADVDTTAGAADLADFTSVIVGSRIKF
ncbi:MAG: porin [Rhodomicrobiaceae bacterium]